MGRHTPPPFAPPYPTGTERIDDNHVVTRRFSAQPDPANYGRQWYDGNGMPYPENGVGSDNSIAPWLIWCHECGHYVAKPRCPIHQPRILDGSGPAAIDRKADKAPPPTVDQLRHHALFLLNQALSDPCTVSPDAIDIAIRILRDL